jgi:peptidoglycan/xylan/chitin deacetylase (PgdA/CDA1 family)
MKKCFLLFLLIVIVNQNSIAQKYVALTFDDAPDSFYTDKLLDILKEENVKATFFVLGTKVKTHPEIVE